MNRKYIVDMDYFTYWMIENQFEYNMDNIKECYVKDGLIHCSYGDDEFFQGSGGRKLLKDYRLYEYLKHKDERFVKIITELNEIKSILNNIK